MRILSAKDISNKTSLSTSHLRRLSKEGKFPQPIQISSFRVGWLDADVDEWIKQKHLALKERLSNERP